MVMKKQVVALSALVFLVSLFLINWQPERTEFLFIAGFYLLAFLAYLILLRNRSKFPFKIFLLIALAAQVLSLIFEPHFSIDYFRFIWDGEITLCGYNPFDYTPNELYNHGITHESLYLENVYTGIGSMSQENYSCYPPVSQAYFMAACIFSNNIFVSTFILKLMLIGTQILGAHYLIKLLNLLNLDRSRIWIIYLNPLWIIECTGNVHFEGAMLSFVFIAFYFLLQKKEFFGSVFMAIAIQLKLIPLILLPFFYRFLDTRKSIIFYMLTVFIVLSLGFVQLNSDNISHFIESLRQYFQVFEFNSFVLYYYLQYGIAETGWIMTRIYGPKLARVALSIIIFLALYGQLSDWKVLFKRMTLGYFAYLMLSSTLHPWYILPLLALSLFTNYSFALLWSFLIFFSYILYSHEGHWTDVRWVIDLEYGILLFVFIYELIRGKSLLKYFALNEDQLMV